MVIGLASTGLYDVDIFPTHGLVDLDPSLSNGEFGEEHIALGNAETITYLLIQLRVRAAAKDNDVADHGARLQVESRSNGESMSTHGRCRTGAREEAHGVVGLWVCSIWDGRIGRGGISQMFIVTRNDRTPGLASPRWCWIDEVHCYEWKHESPTARFNVPGKLLNPDDSPTRKIRHPGGASDSPSLGRGALKHHRHCSALQYAILPICFFMARVSSSGE